MTDDDFVDPDALIEQLYDRRVTELRAEYAAASSWRERFLIRRRIRILRRKMFLNQVAKW